MSDSRSKLEKFIGMLGSEHDGEALNALRFIRKIAADEKKTLVELLLSGKTVYVDRVVFKEGAPPRGERREDVWEAKARAQEARARQREDVRNAEHAAREKRRAEQYAGSFDDAEMNDAEREQARRKKPFRGGRALLNELSWALDNDNRDLDSWQIEFAQDVLAKYREDWELSDSQTRQAKKVIATVRRATEESPV
jgi:hypothetical protein